MIENIESFVKKLHQQGIEAGKAEAQTIISKAEENARVIVAQAGARAKDILEAAQVKAETERLKVKTELELAARDSFSKLRATLTESLSRVLKAGLTEELQDESFLKGLIRDVVEQYVRADSEHKSPIVINLAPETKDALAHWAAHELCSGKRGIELVGELKQSGFACNVGEATVEITEESLVEIFSSFLAPQVVGLLGSAGVKTITAA